MDFEELLREVGNFERYQKIRITLLSLITLPTIFQVYIQVFTAGKGDHWCQSWKAEDCKAFNLTTKECENLKRELSIPVTYDSSSDGIVYLQCQKYNVSGLNLETVAINEQNNLTSLEKIPCDEGWIFDKTTFPSSVVYDFQLVCGKDYLPNIAQSAYFVGSLIGTLATGLISDLFGRRKAILLNLASASIFGIAISFSPNFIIYMVLRFFTAISGQGISPVCYALGNELVTPSKRVPAMAILLVFSGCGCAILSAMAKFISDWKMLHLTVAMSVIILLIVSCFLVPESPRWLLANDRPSDAEVILRKMANGNGKQLAEDFATKVSNTTANVKKANEGKGSMRDVIRSRIGIFLGTTLSFIWMVMSLAFYGHSLNTSSFGIDPYLSLSFFGAIETPAYFFGMFSTGYLGRKNVVFASFILGGICCCLVPVMALPLWKMLIAAAGKFFVTVTYGTVILWTLEMVPTSMRNRLMALLAVSARVGGIIAPLLLILEDIWHGLPVLVFGLLSFAAGFLCLLLPETTDISLPVTMKDTKELYRMRKPSKGQKKGTEADDTDMGHCNKGMQEDETEHNS